jgi:hypothetical protein
LIFSGSILTYVEERGDLTTAKKIIKPIVPTGKLIKVVSLLQRKRGATVEQIANKINWEMRGAWTAISRVRQLGFEVESVKREDGERVYKIAA